jgi:hypothetical protein
MDGAGSRIGCSRISGTVTTNWKKTGTAAAAATWVAVCAYLYLAWPSLAALIESLRPSSSGGRWLIALPRVAFLALGLLAVLGLALKDRWLRAPLALVVDAVVAAPAVAAIALLLEPFLDSVE